jgi:hypothetical protein
VLLVDREWVREYDLGYAEGLCCADGAGASFRAS